MKRKLNDRQVAIIFELISYVLAGCATLSWAMNHPDAPVILLLIAGAIDKYVKKLFIKNGRNDQPARLD